jgi:hypothetical protein
VAARKTRPSERLPPALRALFWDLEARRLDWARDHDLIVSRVLAQGGWREAIVLRRRVGDEGLREWILEHDARGLSPAQVRFWELVLDLPKAKADRWVRAARASVWGKRHLP